MKTTFCLAVIFLAVSAPLFEQNRLLAFDALDVSENRAIKDGTGNEPNTKILVEIFLAKERKEDLGTIKKEFEAVSITRLRAQFFRLGNPPENIAIGKNIPAPVARLAIRIALAYNGGIKFLLPEFRFFPDHIVIGSSAFDEKSQIPVQPEDIEKLTDPTLTTEQFHEHYRSLTGEDRRLPTYLH